MLLVVLVLLVLGSGLAGIASCGRQYEGYQASYQGTAEAAAAALTSTIHASALLAATVDGLPPGPYTTVDAIVMAVNVAVAKASGDYRPPGCVTATTVMRDVRYPGDAVFRFTDCAGPFGLAHLSGALVVRFRQDGLDVQVFPAGQLMDGEVFPDCFTPGLPPVSCQPVDLTGAYQAVFGSDRVLRFGTAGQLTWDQGLNCFALDNGVPFRDTFTHQDIAAATGFHQCGVACPTSGTASTTSLSTAATLTITYDGTNTPTWSSSDGYSGTVTLDCQ